MVTRDYKVEYLLDWKSLSFNAQEQLIDNVIGIISKDVKITTELNKQVESTGLSGFSDQKKYIATLKLLLRNKAIEISKNLRQFVDLDIKYYEQ